VSTFPEIFIQIYRQTNQLKLPKPSISVTPSGQVTWGQSISITCSLTTQYSGGYFDLEKTSSSFHLVQSARSASATFSMAEVTLDNEGVYRCRYLVRDSGSDIISPLSDPLTVSVTGKNIHLKVQNPELAFLYYGIDIIALVSLGSIILFCCVSTTWYRLDSTRLGLFVFP
uniref:Ig-like domain-containing protein n=1 Tax=Sphaeramia orbicularis TaxID=375764 RepID=A0A673AG78_9TELE